MTQYPSVGSPMFYGIFFIAVLIMIAIDMVSLKKNGAHKVSIKEALAWSGIWVAVSCTFAGWLYLNWRATRLMGPLSPKKKSSNSSPAMYSKNPLPLITSSFS